MKRQIMLELAILLLLAMPVLAQMGGSIGDMLDNSLRLISIDFGSIIEKYHPIIDFIIYLVLFINVLKFALRDRLGEQGKSIHTVLAVILAIALSVLEAQTGFNPWTILSPVAGLLLIVLLGFGLYMIITRLGQGRSTATYVALLICYWIIASQIIAYGFDKHPQYGGIVTFALQIGFLAAIFCLVALIVQLARFIGAGRGWSGGGSGLPRLGPIVGSGARGIGKGLGALGGATARGASGIYRGIKNLRQESQRRKQIDLSIREIEGIDERIQQNIERLNADEFRHEQIERFDLQELRRLANELRLVEERYNILKMRRNAQIQHLRSLHGGSIPPELGHTLANMDNQMRELELHIKALAQKIQVRMDHFLKEESNIQAEQRLEQSQLERLAQQERKKLEAERQNEASERKTLGQMMYLLKKAKAAGNEAEVTRLWALIRKSEEKIKLYRLMESYAQANVNEARKQAEINRHIMALKRMSNERVREMNEAWKRNNIPKFMQLLNEVDRIALEVMQEEALQRNEQRKTASKSPQERKAIQLELFDDDAENRLEGA